MINTSDITVKITALMARIEILNDDIRQKTDVIQGKTAIRDRTIMNIKDLETALYNIQTMESRGDA